MRSDLYLKLSVYAVAEIDIPNGLAGGQEVAIKTPHSGQNFALDVPMALELHSKLFASRIDLMYSI